MATTFDVVASGREVASLAAVAAGAAVVGAGVVAAFAPVFVAVVVPDAVAAPTVVSVEGDAAEVDPVFCRSASAPPIKRAVRTSAPAASVIAVQGARFGSGVDVGWLSTVA